MNESIIYDQSFGIIPLMSTHQGLMVLLIQHNAGHWGFPKGHREGGETNLEAAKREFFEETGILKVQIIEGIQFTHQYTFTKDSYIYDKTVTYFPGTISNYVVNLEVEEIQDYVIIPLNTILELDVPDDTKGMFHEIVEYFSGK